MNPPDPRKRTTVHTCNYTDDEEGGSGWERADEGRRERGARGKKKTSPTKGRGGGREEDERAAKGNGGKRADRGAEREEGTEDNKCQNNDPAVVRRTTRRIVGSRRRQNSHFATPPTLEVRLPPRLRIQSICCVLRMRSTWLKASLRFRRPKH